MVDWVTWYSPTGAPMTFPSGNTAVENYYRSLGYTTHPPAAADPAIATVITYAAEFDVLYKVKELLDNNWNTHQDQIPKPLFGVWNEIGKTQPNMFKIHDMIELRYGSPPETERWEGHSKEYVDYTARVALIIHTCQGRQRMQDLKAEMRRILHKNKFALYPPFQLISYLGFGETSEPTQRYWKGTVTIELSAEGKPADSD